MDGIPDFAKPLSSYVTTREEALRIRRALTRYLLSQLEDDHHDGPIGHLSASTGCNVDSVKRPAHPLGSGIHARYLEAVQANLAARRAYNDALQDLRSLNNDPERKSTLRGDPLSGGQELQAYLSVLRSRRERRRTQLSGHYLEKLNAMEAALAGYLALDGELDRVSQLPQTVDVDRCKDSELPTDDGVDTTVKDMERTVLKTKHRLDCERKQRDAARITGPPSSNPVDAAKRLKALGRVRDELVIWVEEKLATASTEENIVSKDHSKDTGLESVSTSLTAKRMLIQEQYKAYLSARQQLLHSVSAASCPLPKDDSITSSIQQQQQLPTETAPGTAADAAAVLGHACRGLLPLSDARKAATTQRSYFSAMLEGEEKTASSALERLRDESHLLPEYPIAGRRSQFQPPALATDYLKFSPSRRPLSSSGRNTAADVVGCAEAWAFASAAAGNETSDYVDKKLALGTEMARSAEEALQDLYVTMNGNYVEAATKSGSEEDQAYEEDIWASETGTTRNRRSVGRVGRLKMPFNGPWSGLYGNVGVIGDT